MQESSSDSSRLQGCSLSLWNVGDLPTVKPEATTTSCRNTHDKRQQAEKSEIKTERGKYTCFFPEGGQIEAADVASWETLSKTSQQATDDKLVWKVEIVFCLACQLPSRRL